MKDFSNLEEYTPKKLRTLRNNLNNRIESFKLKGDNVKELQKGHALYQMDKEQCDALLTRVNKLLKLVKA